jgi:chromate reductase, NAD(P)H dehydrogenase (quinone)
MRILGISGSLRRDSLNTGLLRAAAEELPPGVDLVLFEGLRDVPPFDPDEDGPAAPEAVRRLRAAIRGADAVLLAVPEYNSSLPGQLKNALDWASRPVREGALRDRPAAVVGASTGMFGAVWAQAEARKVLGAMGARVVGEELPLGHAHERFDAGGALVDDEARAALRNLLAQLVAEAQPALAG